MICLIWLLSIYVVIVACVSLLGETLASWDEAGGAKCPKKDSNFARLSYFVPGLNIVLLVFLINWYFKHYYRKK